MKSTRSKILAVSLLTLLLVAVVAIYVTAQQLMIDRYAGQPQVVSLPPGYDPLAKTSPYAGPHPSEKARAPDPYAYPIPDGGSGPVEPTYADSLEYPFACRTEAAGLGQPLPDNQNGAGTVVYALDDAGNKTDRIVGYSKDCSLNTQVQYFFLSRTSGGFLPLTEQSDDVEELVINGKTVPFVVRLESGTINRYIYMIGLLKGANDTAEKPDLRYWNRKLIYLFRGGVGIGRRQGRVSADYILNRLRSKLRKGYAVAHSTANQTSTSYDIELAENTLARVKRHFSARYGEPHYTIGLGGSGGAIQQYLIDQNNPGLLDGGIAMQSYPDMITQTTKVMDCELLEHFFDVIDADNEKWHKWSQRSWIEGFNASDDMTSEIQGLLSLRSIRLGRWPRRSVGQTECTRSWRNLTPQIANPRYTYFASLFAPDIVNQVSWTYWDNQKRVFGTDDYGFARRTYDNVGVQYGLNALKSKQITAAEFLRLNDFVGGWKPAAEMMPERYWLYSPGRSSLADLSVWSHHNMHAKESPATPARRSEGDIDAIAAAYRSGQVFIGRSSMPIIDFRHYLEPELNMHHSFQSFSARLRIMRRQGHADSQIIWFTRKPKKLLGDAVDVMDRWLANMRSKPNSSIADAKPIEATDRCYSATGQLIASGEGVWNGVWNGKDNGECMNAYPIFSNPRIEAGDDYVGDIFKCYLQPIDAAIAGGVYAPIDMSPFREELYRVFPDGVCDYSRGDAALPEDLLSFAKAPE